MSSKQDDLANVSLDSATCWTTVTSRIHGLASQSGEDLRRQQTEKRPEKDGFSNQ